VDRACDPDSWYLALAGRQYGKNVRPFVLTGHGRFDGDAIDLAAEVDLLCRHELQ
jgi:hypothetical protein